MKNPLNKRIFRELRSNIGRYGSIFIVMLMTISFISSFFISQNSVKISYDDSHIRGKIEDGYIEFNRELNKDEEKFLGIIMLRPIKTTICLSITRTIN